jgi:hypothetical protein
MGGIQEFDMNEGMVSMSSAGGKKGSPTKQSMIVGSTVASSEVSMSSGANSSTAGGAQENGDGFDE